MSNIVFYQIGNQWYCSEPQISLPYAQIDRRNHSYLNRLPTGAVADSFLAARVQGSPPNPPKKRPPSAVHTEGGRFACGMESLCPAYRSPLPSRPRRT